MTWIGRCIHGTEIGKFSVFSQEPTKDAREPNSSSIRRSWLYLNCKKLEDNSHCETGAIASQPFSLTSRHLARRSDRQGAPVLICPVRRPLGDAKLIQTLRSYQDISTRMHEINEKIDKNLAYNQISDEGVLGPHCHHAMQLATGRKIFKVITTEGLQSHPNDETPWRPIQHFETWLQPKMAKCDCLTQENSWNRGKNM